MIPAAAAVPAPVRPTPLGKLHSAARFGGLILGLITAMILNPVGLLAMVFILLAALTWTGMTGRAIVARIKPWWLIILLVLATHTFTTVSAAPVGHPSFAGLLSGIRALARVSCTVGFLALYTRITTLEDMVEGVTWWLQPLRLLGLRTEELGMMLAVTMGTTPVVLSEGRRIEMATRLRRTGNRPLAKSRLLDQPRLWFCLLVDRARVVIPIMELLARRADALSLSLRNRQPDENTSRAAIPFWQLMALVAWIVVLLISNTNLLTGGTS